MMFALVTVAFFGVFQLANNAISFPLHAQCEINW